MGELPLQGIVTTAGTVIAVLSTCPPLSSESPSGDNLNDPTTLCSLPSPFLQLLLSHCSRLQAPTPSSVSSRVPCLPPPPYLGNKTVQSDF